jgi:serralysin
MATITSSSFSSALWTSALSTNLFNGVSNLYQLGNLLSNISVSSSTQTGNTISGFGSDGGRFTVTGRNFDTAYPSVTGVIIDNRPEYYLEARGSISATTLKGTVSYVDLMVGATDIKAYGSISTSGYGSLSKIYYSNNATSIELTGSIVSSVSGTSGTLSQVTITNGGDTFTVSGGSWNYSTLNNANSFDDFFALITQGSDTINGSTKNDVIKSGLGNDSINGGAGVDSVIFSGALSNYTLKSGATSLTITDKVANRNGVDILANIERLQFADATIAFDIGANQIAGSGYMLYKAAFNRTPDAGGLGFWINQMDKGMSYNDVAKNFVNSAEFKDAFGGSNPTVNTLVTKLYNNVLNRAPDAGGLAFWQEKLTTGWSTADVLGYFSTSGENVTNVTPLIANGIQYQQFVG